MVRQSLDAGAATGATLLNGSPTDNPRHVRFSYRAAADGVMQNSLDDIGSGEAPVWVRLERRGETLTASYSLDGATWPPGEKAEEIPGLPDKVLAGVAACKGAVGASGPQALHAVIANVAWDPLPLFLRGDSNDDGKADMSDAVTILWYLFLGIPMNDCKDAADVNDDGMVDISDPVRLLYYYFIGAERPPDPFGTCGVDPTTVDPLDCKDFSKCP
jgi:hypothetical protein